MEEELHRLTRTLLEVVPLVNRTIRAEIRAHRIAELSAPQFRVLGYVKQGVRVSLTDIAEYMGLTPPSMSTMVDGLVARGLVDRERDEVDRRKVGIVITARGEEIWSSTWRTVCASIEKRLRDLGEGERQELLGAFEVLRLLFSHAEEGVLPASGGRAR